MGKNHITKVYLECCKSKIWQSMNSRQFEMWSFSHDNADDSIGFSAAGSYTTKRKQTMSPPQNPQKKNMSTWKLHWFLSPLSILYSLLECIPAGILAKRMLCVVCVHKSSKCNPRSATFNFGTWPSRHMLSWLSLLQKQRPWWCKILISSPRPSRANLQSIMTV